MENNKQAEKEFKVIYGKEPVAEELQQFIKTYNALSSYVRTLGKIAELEGRTYKISDLIGQKVPAELEGKVTQEELDKLLSSAPTEMRVIMEAPIKPLVKDLVHRGAVPKEEKAVKIEIPAKKEPLLGIVKTISLYILYGLGYSIGGIILIYIAVTNLYCSFTSDKCIEHWGNAGVWFEIRK